MSSIHRFQSTWRSITFNTHLDDSGLVDDPAHLVKANLSSRFILDAVDISRVSVQDYRELRQFLEGGEPNEAYEGVRAINGQGRIQGSSAADLEDKAWALNEAFSVAACRIAAQGLTPTGVLPFNFKRASVGGTKSLRFYARPGPGRPVWLGRRAEGLVRPFSWQLIAFDPFAYDQSETQTAWVSNPVAVTNPGNMYARPKIRITFTGAGSATLAITNSTTGKVLTINASTAANGEVWIIDTARSTIERLSDSANRYSTRVSGYVSDMILLPGANSWTFSSATGVSQFRFDFRGAYA